MTKFALCGQETFSDEVCVWQPFGPAESPMSFSLPGNHYRGFPAIKICYPCRYQRLDVAAGGAGGAIHFRYKGLDFVFDGTRTPFAAKR